MSDPQHAPKALYKKKPREYNLTVKFKRRVQTKSQVASELSDRGGSALRPWAAGAILGARARGQELKALFILFFWYGTVQLHV